MQDENIELLRKQIEMPLTDMEMVIRKDLLRKLLFSKKTKIKDKNDKEKCIEEDKLSREVIELATRIIEIESLDNQKKLYKIIKENYQFLARRNFKEFLIAIEWNFNDDMKLYKIRKIVFDEWAKELQSLEDGELRGLSISAPPRTGKTAIRNDVFYVVYVKASREKLFFCFAYSSNGEKSIYRYTNVSNR